MVIYVPMGMNGRIYVNLHITMMHAEYRKIQVGNDQGKK